MKWNMNADEDCGEDFENIMNSLKPSDFYFQLEESDDDIVEFWFLITPKEYFDANRYLLDNYIPLTVFPPGFCDICDSTFEYDGDAQVGRQLLLQAGFIEKKMF